MNKNLYRIVFNTARGMLMVVADIAGAGRAAASSSSPPSGVGQRLSQLTGRVTGLRFALLLALGAVQPVQAGIVADGSAPGNQQPTIISSANGTPQVNIQTPSAAGVSRNVYSQFDVDRKGVVLNNSHQNTPTQIAGMVTANPWLAKGEAKVILNEVNSRDPSRLNGFIEVAGRQAQVVIANPAGITCSGCGFINANRATLTTGQVQMTNGQLTGYNVDRGEIVVQGGGLDSSLQDHTDLIARAVKINAGVWAKNLAVTTGRNRVDAAHRTVSAKAADDSLRPQLAIDVAQLGGMYANKIVLRGTEAGVGVHNAGALNALAGDVVINADGLLTSSGAITASRDLQLTSAGGVDNRGTLYAGGDTRLQMAGALSNSGILAAQGDTTIAAAAIHSSAQSVLAAGMASDGKLGTRGNLTLNSRGQLTANGQNSAAGQLSARGTGLDLSGSQTWGHGIDLQATTGDITTAGARLAATQTLAARSAGVLNNDGGQLSADRLSLTAKTLSNRRGTVQQLGQHDLTLDHATKIDNRGGTLASNGKNLTLSTANLNNQQGNIVHAGDGALIIKAGQLDGGDGRVVSNGSLALSGALLQLDNTAIQAGSISLNAGSLSHRGGRMTQSGSGSLHLNVTDLFDNAGGSVAANGALALTGGTLNNQQGQLIAANGHDLTLTLDGALNNRDGLIAADGSLTAVSGAVDNRGGLIQAGSALSLNSRGAEVINRGTQAVSRDGVTQGGIISGGSMTLQTGGLDNRHGTIAAKTLAATTGDLNNAAGRMLADNGLTLSSGAIDNRAGSLRSGAALTLDSHGQSLTNAGGGLIAATGSLTLTGGALDNRQGRLIGSGDTWLGTGLLDNRGGQLASLSALSLFNHGLLNDDGGLLQSAGDLLIDTRDGTLSNTHSGDRGGITSQGTLTLNTAALDNRQGVLAGNRQLTLTAGDVNNQQGQILALGELALNAVRAVIDNRAGLIQGAAAVTLNAATVLNQHTLGAQQGIQGGSLTLNAVDVDNDRGAMRVDDVLALTLSGHLNNAAGLLSAQNRLQAQAGQVSNAAGAIEAGRQRDTTFTGAQASGEKVTMEVGRNLTLSSERDGDNYDSKQHNASVGGSVGFGSGNASVSLSRDKMHSTWDSVNEQTGVFAGKEGFDIRVGEHTQLNGAVIGSTAAADRNKLDTGTLGFSDIDNKAAYDVQHQSVGISSGGSIGGQFVGNMANGLLTGVNDSGSAGSTTHSAVSDGTIIIRDKDRQTQDVADLSRDVENANPGLDKIFDKEKEQNRLKEAQLLGEIGSQIADIARTQGRIDATKAANEKIKTLTPDQLNAAEAAWRKANPGETPTPEQITGQAYQALYDQAFKESGFGTGGKYQQGIQAVTAAVQGLAGGDITAALAGGANPYIAGIIKSQTGDNVAANAVAHALWGGVSAILQGNSAAAGAAGATAGELAARVIAGQLYPDKKPSELSESEKQTVSVLATAAAGLAGGMAGGGTADAVAGAQAGKNSVENNFLSAAQINDFAARAKGCEARGDCKQVVQEMEDLSLKQRNELIITCASDAGACKEKYGDIPANGMLVHEAIDKALGEDIPWSMKNDLSVLLMQQMDESGIVNSTEFAQQLQTLYGLDSQKAEILAGVAMAAVTGGMGKAGKPSQANTTKLPNGQQVNHYEASLAGLPPGERVAQVKQMASSVAQSNAWVKDNKLTKMNNRDVYRGSDGNLYALDTQHGRFELVNAKNGKHQGEVDMGMKFIEGSKDTSGGHDLKVK